MDQWCENVCSPNLVVPYLSMLSCFAEVVKIYMTDETAFWMSNMLTVQFTDDQLQQPIFIKGSTVDIAYDYTKKKNVFRLTTPAGSEYLFQAEDRPAMLTWIKTIQPACLPDGSVCCCFISGLYYSQRSQYFCFFQLHLLHLWNCYHFPTEP